MLDVATIVLGLIIIPVSVHVLDNAKSLGNKVIWSFNLLASCFLVGLVLHNLLFSPAA